MDGGETHWPGDILQVPVPVDHDGWSLLLLRSFPHGVSGSSYSIIGAEHANDKIALYVQIRL